MTHQDYKIEKDKRIEFAMSDIIKKSINTRYNLIWVLIIILIWYYYEIDWLYLIALFVAIYWAWADWEIRWYKKWFDYGYDEGYEVMQEKTDSQH